MSLYKKVVFGTLATGFLFSPLGTADQADAATGESWKPDINKPIFNGNSEVTFHHWIKGSDLLKGSSDIGFQDGFYYSKSLGRWFEFEILTILTLKDVQTLALERNGINIEKDKEYKMKYTIVLNKDGKIIDGDYITADFEGQSRSVR